jgi:hypothetical protein
MPILSAFLPFGLKEAFSDSGEEKGYVCDSFLRVMVY